nr:unnamed protein product [Callosobruchus chinensis]
MVISGNTFSSSECDGVTTISSFRHADSKCLLRYDLSAKVLWHLGHSKFLSAECVCIWARRVVLKRRAKLTGRSRTCPPSSKTKSSTVCFTFAGGGRNLLSSNLLGHFLDDSILYFYILQFEAIMNITIFEDFYEKICYPDYEHIYTDAAQIKEQLDIATLTPTSAIQMRLPDFGTVFICYYDSR